MLFRKDILIKYGQSAAARYGKSARAVLEDFTKIAPANFDIFLSHSYQDSDAILGLWSILEAAGFAVYVDWIVDRQLDRSLVTPSAARVLRQRMCLCKCLLYATSENASKSLWMPWELGYFDGHKGKVAIAPISEETEYTYTGREYLGLYPYIAWDITALRELIYVVCNPDHSKILLPQWMNSR